MTTFRHGARRSHHPVVRRDGAGRWRWSCDCGAAARLLATAPSWRSAVTGALVHQQYCAGE
jgi:hypothetical protein